MTTLVLSLLLASLTADYSRAVRSPDGRIRFDGLLKADNFDKGWTSASMFAPDGRPWPDYTETNVTRVQKIGGTMGSPLVALLNHSPRERFVKPSEDYARARFHAATGNRPGEGLTKPLTKWWDNAVGQGENWLYLDRPLDTNYIQIEIKTLLSRAWRKVAEFKPTYGPLRREPVVSSRRYVFVGPYMIGVNIDGSVDETDIDHSLKLHRRKARAAWNGVDTQSRTVARLKSGRGLVLPTSMWGDGWSGYVFALDSKGDAVCKTDKGPVPLESVEAFEIETRRFGNPVYLAAKLPPIYGP